MSSLICLISSGHVASTPRLVKNASALAEAGYAVHVVAASYYPPLDTLDPEIFASAGWTHSVVNSQRGAAAFGRKLLRRLLRQWAVRRPFTSVRIAARLQHAEALHLGAVAARVPAQLYLGHCLPGLPAAAWAGRVRGVPYGFDAEDFHDGETEEAIRDPVESAARRTLQSALLPGCVHLTAASPLISQQYERTYGVSPLTLLNVFPLAEAPAAPGEPGPITEERPARLYWFSQTTGSGRGLEAVIAIAAQMRTPVELHLRGFVTPDTRSRFRALAQSAGLRRPIVFLPPGPAPEMARLASGCDLGLSTEERQPPNRDLCLTNKIFTYLLGGIPQLLSATAAQQALAPELGSAALLCDLADPAAVARRLDEFFSDPARVAEARRTARELGRHRFCWDLEKEKLLASIRLHLPASA
jgi:hypothetical protein